MSRRREDFRNRHRIVNQRSDSPRYPRIGARVTDGMGGTYTVIDVNKGRLLLLDEHGDRYPIQGFRLNHDDPRVAVGAWRVVGKGS